jgi:UPF0176 protein
MPEAQPTILLFYKYVDISDPVSLMSEQKQICESLDLKGRIIIAAEGINGTVEGNLSNTEKYIDLMKQNSLFSDVIFKKSNGTGTAFPKLSIKVRDEIVSTHLDYTNQLGPTRNMTGKYLSAEGLNRWIHSDKRFFIIDMRNDYEYSVGHFAGSIMPKNLKNFRNLPKILPEIEHLRDETIVTVCTGGIRCEKASGFLVKHGFSDVYQLQDGIVTYMEKYPNEDFLGKLYVFDGRVAMGFNTDDAAHVIVGACQKCGITSENIIDYYEIDGTTRDHGIICQKCVAEGKVIMD